MNRSQNDAFNRQQNRGPGAGNPLFVGPNRPDPREPGQFVDPRQAGHGANLPNGASLAAGKEPTHSKFVVELTDSNFRKQVLKSKQPVLVDIWAPWCGPCKAISPMIDELAADYAGTLKVGKLNLDECPEVAKAFNVEGLPTLLIFNRGELVDSILGAVEREKLEEAIDAVMP
jgi:thioredoxin 1